MKFIMFIRKKIVFTFLLLVPALLVFAQDAGKPEVKQELSNNNLLAILLTATSIILALVIWGMGRALVGVSKLVLEKSRKSKEVLGVLLLIAFSLMAQTAGAQPAPDAAVTTITNYGGLSESMFNAFLIVIGAEFVAIIFLAFSIKRMYLELLPPKTAAEVKESSLAAWWNKMDTKLFTRAVPVSAEADVLLDHDYDGIKELDNALPPWWKYGFYFTIGVAFIYIFNFHVSGNGKNPSQEWVAEMENAQRAKELFESKNKDKVDETKLQMADAAGINAAKTMFASNCVSCHGEKAQGAQVGPNLTDDYWIHKGSLTDIYLSIKHGYPDKGMPVWSLKFSPKEMVQLASYVKSLHGTNPLGARTPQGDLYVEEAKPAADSTAAKTTDSTLTKKAAVPVAKQDSSAKK